MRCILRVFLVLSLALGLAAGVICLERSYRPRTGWGLAQVLSEHTEHAASDAEAEAAFGGVSAPAAPVPRPGQPATVPPPAGSPARNASSPATTQSRDRSSRPDVRPALSAPSGKPGGAGPPSSPAAAANSAGGPVGNAVRPASAEVEQPEANRPMLLRQTAGPAGNSSLGGQRVWRVDVLDDPSRHSASERLAGLRQANLFDLVRQLRGGDQRAAAARAELLRRGLTEVDLELGRRYSTRTRRSAGSWSVPCPHCKASMPRRGCCSSARTKIPRSAWRRWRWRARPPTHDCSPRSRPSRDRMPTPASASWPSSSPGSTTWSAPCAGGPAKPQRK